MSKRIGAGLFCGCLVMGAWMSGICKEAAAPESDLRLQRVAQEALKEGLATFGANDGCAIVMDAQKGTFLALVGGVARTYELGSVMKPITVATAIELDPHKYGAETVYRTAGDEAGYEELPGDGSHVWEETMTLKEALTHSSNIVIGKLGQDLGPEKLRDGLARFGFKDPDLTDEAWTRPGVAHVAIGQYLKVSPLQMTRAYQALAVPKEGGPVSPETARKVREMLLDVASPKGTARRAAIEGVKIAGKSGTAQKQSRAGGYLPGLYRASFVGIIPADEPKYVIYVMLDFNEKAHCHQGGNTAAVVWRRIALKALGLSEGQK